MPYQPFPFNPLDDRGATLVEIQQRASQLAAAVVELQDCLGRLDLYNFALSLSPHRIKFLHIEASAQDIQNLQQLEWEATHEKRSRLVRYGGPSAVAASERYRNPYEHLGVRAEDYYEARRLGIIDIRERTPFTEDSMKIDVEIKTGSPFEGLTESTEKAQQAMERAMLSLKYGKHSTPAEERGDDDERID